MIGIEQIPALLQILIIDLSLAADNALAIGLAAAGLPPEKRKQAVWLGLAVATGLRIVMAFFTTQLLAVTGLIIAGGILLLYVTWKMYHDVRKIHRGEKHDATDAHGDKPLPKTMRNAMLQIAFADISMSLDNVLAVAGAARDHTVVLIIGLALSVALMAFAANLIVRLLHRWTWLGYIGVATVAYVALHMIWDGAVQVGWIKI